jgi:hypothetical protein
MTRSHGCGCLVLLWALLWIVGAAHAEESSPEAKAKDPGGDKVVAGMSIVGNDEAPKSLVIVPWKSSGLGQSLDVSRIMEDGRRPVDREVFGRELDYYEIRIGSSP